MTHKNVLNDTFKVLELIEESEEKASLLRHELKKNEEFYSQVILELKEVRERKTKSLADLNENQHLKTIIKEFNEQFVIFAQQLYSSGQELFTEINSRESELDSVDEILRKNEDKYQQKLGEYKHEEETLNSKLISIEGYKIQEEGRKNAETQTLIAENKNLNKEINDLNEFIKKCENYDEQDMALSQQETEYACEILNLQECLKSTEEEIIVANDIIKEMKNYKEKVELEANDYISELNIKIQEVVNESKLAANILEENKVQNEELYTKINNLALEEREEEYEKCESILKAIEITMRQNEETMKKELMVCEQSALEYEEMCKIQGELNNKLNIEAESFKIKTEKLDDELIQIAYDIVNLEAQMLPKNLEEELIAKKEELRELKRMRYELKEEYNKKLSEYQAETKKLSDEIKDIELENKNLQEEIDKGEGEMNQMHEDEEEKRNEKQREEEKSKQLDNEVQNLTSELTKIKSEQSKRSQKAESRIMAAPKHIPQKVTKRSNQNKKLKMERHWDSDSSIEGEDRRFSEMAKQKIRMKKANAFPK